MNLYFYYIFFLENNKHAVIYPNLKNDPLKTDGIDKLVKPLMLLQHLCFSWNVFNLIDHRTRFIK